MANCYLCWSRRVRDTASGTCVVCQQPVCTPPPAYPGVGPHASECGCGCGRPGVFCLADAEEHASNDHASTPERCFSRLAIETAAKAFETAATAIDNRPLEQADVDELNRFLNAVRPGRAALLKVYERIPRDEAVLDETLMTPSLRRAYVAFTGSFFTTAGLERCLVVAASSLAASLRQLPDTYRPEDFSEPVQRGMAVWHRIERVLNSSDAPPGHDALRRWLPRVRDERAINNLERVLRYSPDLSDPSNIVDYLVFGEVSVGVHA